MGLWFADALTANPLRPVSVGPVAGVPPGPVLTAGPGNPEIRLKSRTAVAQAATVVGGTAMCNEPRHPLADYALISNREPSKGVNGDVGSWCDYPESGVDGPERRTTCPHRA